MTPPCKRCGYGQPPVSEVYVVNLIEESDGLHVFTRKEDAERMFDAAQKAGREVVATTEPVFTESAEKIIEQLVIEVGA